MSSEHHKSVDSRPTIPDLEHLPTLSKGMNEKSVLTTLQEEQVGADLMKACTRAQPSLTPPVQETGPQNNGLTQSSPVELPKKKESPGVSINKASRPTRWKRHGRDKHQGKEAQVLCYERTEHKTELQKRIKRDEMEIDSVGSKRRCEASVCTGPNFDQPAEHNGEQQSPATNPALQDRQTQ